jgi:hypothetical protein
MAGAEPACEVPVLPRVIEMVMRISFFITHCGAGAAARACRYFTSYYVPCMHSQERRPH